MHLFMVVMANVMSRERKPESKIDLLERWLRVSGGKWLPHNFEMFVGAFERFMWEEETMHQSMKWYGSELRKKFPKVEGTRLDVQIPATVRTWLRDISSDVASSASTQEHDKYFHSR